MEVVGREKMVSQEYKDYYEEIAKRDERIWANTGRLNYQADVWYNRNRNTICLDMIKDVCKGKRILAVGVSGWVEKEFLDSIDCKEMVRTNLISKDDTVKEMDACNMTCPDNSFDVVICRELIEHVPDDRTLLNEISRVLTQRGYLFISTPNVFNVLPDGKEHVRGYTPLILLHTLSQFGFKVIDKRGNVPNVFYTLLPLALQGIQILPEFQDAAERIRNFTDSYYVGTLLIVLAQKRE